MATAEKLAWDIAKELWYKGISTNQIERETGIKAVTIRKRASREHWDAALAPEAPAADKATEVAMQDVASRISARVVNMTESLLITLRDLGKPETFRDAKDCAQALSTSYMAARRALGLDQDGGVRSFSLTIVNPGRAGDPTTPERQVIDVQAEPAPSSTPPAAYPLPHPEPAKP